MRYLVAAVVQIRVVLLNLIVGIIKLAVTVEHQQNL